MEILIVLIILFVFTVIPIKISANILKIEGATLGVCFIAVILSIIASVLAAVLIGEGFFPNLISFLITAVFFSWLFKTNTITGFVFAGISIGVQFCIVLIAAGLLFIDYKRNDLII